MSIRSRRRFAWVFAAASIAAAIACAMPGCSSKSSGLGIAAGCALNSDCNDPLVCIFSLCHQECASSRDCPNGEACVETSQNYGICQLPAEANCSPTESCSGGLVCGQDDKCRASCMSVSNCLTGQLCIQQVCYDPGELDGGSSSSGGSSGGGSGGGSGGSSGSSSGGSDSGNSCPSAQTQFGGVAQGDTNANFQSGIGLRTATQLLIFDGYQGPDPVGDAGTVTYVYAQAFDPVSGQSKGPAAPLFPGSPTGATFYVFSAATAPTGEIALLYGLQNGLLYAAFLTEDADAGTGTAGLQLQKSFQISTTFVSEPQLAWSTAAKAFVISFVYTGSLMEVQKYLPNGNSAGGSTNPVPTENGGATVSGYYNEGVVAPSNGVFGVVYGNSSSLASMTVLDPLGNQIGSAFTLVTSTSSTWETLGGTSAGFVALYDISGAGGVGEVLVPVAADGGVPAAFAGDAGDAGAFAGFQFPGTKAAVYARAINDDVGGVGGVGAAILYQDNLSFAYVNADGLTHVGPATLISHAYSSGDYVDVNNTAGSFAVSLYDHIALSTQALASGCTP